MIAEQFASDGTGVQEVCGSLSGHAGGTINDSKILYRLRADDPTEVRDQFDLPLAHVTAINIQAKRLWAMDGKAREVTLFRLQKPLKTLGTYDLDPFIRGATPTGLSISGKNAWIVTENPSAILRIPLRKLKKSES